MLILFDHVTPRGIARHLVGHTVTKAKERGWDTLANGDLLAEAERAGFDVVLRNTRKTECGAIGSLLGLAVRAAPFALLTADKNMRYQQNLTGRRIAIVVLSTPQWPVVRFQFDKIAAAVNAATPGSYAEVILSKQVP